LPQPGLLGDSVVYRNKNKRKPLTNTILFFKVLLSNKGTGVPLVGVNLQEWVPGDCVLARHFRGSEKREKGNKNCTDNSNMQKYNDHGFLTTPGSDISADSSHQPFC
jgi:hypothetical protein